MERNFFYSESFNWWDKWTIFIYALITGCICYMLTQNITVNMRRWIFAYGIVTHLFIYFFNYRSLRNFNVFIVWCFFAALHFYIFLHFQDFMIFKMRNGNALTPLRNTIILLCVFQLLRFISIKISNQELVSPARGGKTDIWNERKPNGIDFISLIVYFIITIGLNSF